MSVMGELGFGFGFGFGFGGVMRIGLGSFVLSYFCSIWLRICIQLSEMFVWESFAFGMGLCDLRTCERIGRDFEEDRAFRLGFSVATESKESVRRHRKPLISCCNSILLWRENER